MTRRYFIVGLVLWIFMLMSFTNITNINAQSDNSIHNTEQVQQDREVLTKDPATLTQEDLEKFLDLALNEAITVDEAQKFINALSSEQHQLFDSVIEKRTPPHKDTPEELEEARKNEEQLQKSNNQLESPQSVNAVCDPAAIAQGFCWRQPIEYFTPYINYLEDKAPSWYMRLTTSCDNDPNDTDLVLYFDITSVNLNGLKWSTSSARIYTLADKELNGFNYDNYGAYLCINNAVTMPVIGVSDATVFNSVRMQLLP